MIKTGKKTTIIVTMILFGIFPTVSSLFRPHILDYIVYWENVHCTETTSHSPYGVSDIGYKWYKCDNGDLMEKSNNTSDMKRIFKGGIKNTHYPYSWFY